MIRRVVAAAACLAILLSSSMAASAGEKEQREQTFKLPFKKTTTEAGYAAPSFSNSPYTGLISKYAKTYGVPVALAHAVVRIESNFNPKARGGAGEIGLMQIKPTTARMMGYSGSNKGLYDPETNLRYGMKYLSMAHELGDGQTCSTILKYNAGHGAKRMNPVSKRYCGKVQALIGSL